MKKYKILGISLALSLALTGCTTTDITLSDTSNEINLEVSWWGGDSRNEYTLEALREYEKENRNINIDMVYGEFTGFEAKNDIKMFSKNESDVMQINYAWMEKYNQQGLSFYDLNSWRWEGPLGTPLGLVHWKRASSPVEAGTAGYL